MKKQGGKQVSFKMSENKYLHLLTKSGSMGISISKYLRKLVDSDIQTPKVFNKYSDAEWQQKRADYSKKYGD